jgi:hypothetical protein
MYKVEWPFFRGDTDGFAVCWIPLHIHTRLTWGKRRELTFLETRCTKTRGEGEGN